MVLFRQTNIFPRADLKIAISSGTDMILVAKQHGKGRKHRMMPWLFFVLWPLSPFCIFVRAKQASYCTCSHFNTRSLLCILTSLRIAIVAVHIVSLTRAGSFLRGSSSPWASWRSTGEQGKGKRKAPSQHSCIAATFWGQQAGKEPKPVALQE